MELTLRTVIVLVMLFVATLLIASILLTWNSNSMQWFSSGLKPLRDVLIGGN